MDELLKFLNTQGGQGDYLSNVEVICALGLSAICSVMIGNVYRYTHKGSGYSQSYVQSLLLLGDYYNTDYGCNRVQYRASVFTRGCIVDCPLSKCH